MQPFRAYTMSDKVSWSIVAVPSQVWADKVFPDLPLNLSASMRCGTRYSKQPASIKKIRFKPGETHTKVTGQQS